ncbi:hypothetical protein AMS68_005023 [Peltaster fructicola]|uniref:Carboxylic ester hydrolase n=1 Tax=Peltaster fructicola TaxID=286661 RepID=A0A6H0XXU5_9PEZI|nr:hypothetical protein AMS68_005023 [Peltaster fructicola]
MGIKIGFVLLLAASSSILVRAGVPWGYNGGYGGNQGGSRNNTTPTARIQNGSVTGVHSTTYNQDFFLGVPFAQPPVGELRFRNPQSLNSSYNNHDASQYAPSCVGYGGDDIGYPVSEDCLYLNVIRPSGYQHDQLPVGVWIHGGGLVMGGSRDERYNLSFIVENSVKIGKPIIAVSINYRLSGWGFLSSAEVSGSGNTNLGLRDQRLALHWLQDNIAAFGGDTQKVTIWGESAGAASVGWHLTAYNGRDDKLFRAGIMESGNPITYFSYSVEADYQPEYDALVNMTGCADQIDTLDCLRNAPYATINNFFNSTAGSNWNPVVDGDFIQRWGSIQLNQGDFVHVPIIDGANTDEGTSFGPTGINTTAQFAAYAASQATSNRLPAVFADQVPSAYPDTAEYRIPSDAVVGDYTYPPSDGALYRRTAAYGGDVVMIANRRATCQTWAENGVAAYCYRFNTRPAGVPFYLGVPHFQEVAFVFDNTNGYGYNAEHSTINPFQDKPQSYSDLAFLMDASWVSFIYDLDPNSWTGRNGATPAWPAYSTATPQDIVWDANATALAYVESDTFRQEGIQWIIDHALAYKR